MKTLLVIVPGRNGGEGGYGILVAETGEHLASHFCSHGGFAMGDLYSGRPERIKKWTERFGELEVKFLEDTDLSNDELHRRNKEWFASLPKEETEKQPE